MMRYSIHTERGEVPADIVELTVGVAPGYRITVPGYNATAMCKHMEGGFGENWWEVTVTAPGRKASVHQIDAKITAKTVDIYGGRLLVRYIEENAIPLRNGQVPRTEPTAPVDRDAKYRTGRVPSYRRTKHGRLRKNHNGILGDIWDAIVDVFWD